MGTLCNRLTVLPLYRNARFWHWFNDGWVKLTLHPGESLSWGWFRRDSEGWTRYNVTWSYDGLVVSRRSMDEGRDCDGRLDRYGEDQCSRDRLNGRLVIDRSPGDPLFRPDWQPVEFVQRDYSAEAMGY